MAKTRVHRNVVFIDEPLELNSTTLTKSSLDAVRRIFEQASRDGFTFGIKLHPRSRPGKYADGYDIIDGPFTADYVVGYSSNMLNYDFGQRQTFTLDDSCDIAQAAYLSVGEILEVIAGDLNSKCLADRQWAGRKQAPESSNDLASFDTGVLKGVLGAGPVE